MAVVVDEKCLFCAIIKGVIPSFKVYETDHWWAGEEASPLLFSTSVPYRWDIPRSSPNANHARTLADLPDEYLREIGPVIRKVALSTGAEHYNILQNNGKLAFQHVDHVHFHVIPKTSETDGLPIQFLENFPKKEVGKEELAATLEEMKGRL